MQETACKRCGFSPWVVKIPWRRKWQLTPIFLPGKSHGQRSLVGYSPRGRKESGTTEWFNFHFSHQINILIKSSFLKISCKLLQAIFPWLDPIGIPGYGNWCLEDPETVERIGVCDRKCISSISSGIWKCWKELLLVKEASLLISKVIVLI